MRAETLFDIVLWFCAGALLGLVALCTFKVYNKPPVNAWQAVYEDVTKAYGPEAKQFPLVLSDEEDINAYADGYNVVVTKGMRILLGDNKDAIAVVLAHELAHNVLGHPGNLMCMIDTMSCEKQADRYAKVILDRGGEYDVCEGTKGAVGAISWIFNDLATEDHGTHPAPINRIKEACTPNVLTGS